MSEYRKFNEILEAENDELKRTVKTIEEGLSDVETWLKHQAQFAPTWSENCAYNKVLDKLRTAKLIS
jgi:site-specific recombinase XerD